MKRWQKFCVSIIFQHDLLKRRWNVFTLSHVYIRNDTFFFFFQAGQRLAHQLEVGGSGNDLCAFLRMSRSTASQSMHNSSTTSLQYLVITKFYSFKPGNEKSLMCNTMQRTTDSTFFTINRTGTISILLINWSTEWMPL